MSKKTNLIDSLYFNQDPDLYVTMTFKLPGQPEPEIIINPAANFKAKADYIMNNYDDELRNLRSPEVRITDWSFSLPLHIPEEHGEDRER